MLYVEVISLQLSESLSLCLSLQLSDSLSLCLQTTYRTWWQCHTLVTALGVVALWWHVLQTRFERPAF